MLGVKSCSGILTISYTHKSDTGGFERPPLSSSEMTEEEMIDLALRLSEQEASIVAIRRQKEEEEAMMKAIQESVSRKPLTVCKCGHLVSQPLLVASGKDKLAARLNHEHEPIQGTLCFTMKSVIVMCRYPSRISHVLLNVRACWMEQMLLPPSALAGDSRTQTEGRHRPSVRGHQVAAAHQRRTRNEVKPRILL